ncbi:MAG: hypothetical protein BWY25_01339 [Chloroflexi bacterium ADurb.Bin222]|nr:MAG: hypothetical protein BWY25_01339 [Chloroflexi bacterium ADurb.Bin222]
MARHHRPIASGRAPLARARAEHVAHVAARRRAARYTDRGRGAPTRRLDRHPRPQRPPDPSLSGIHPRRETAHQGGCPSRAGSPLAARGPAGTCHRLHPPGDHHRRASPFPGRKDKNHVASSRSRHLATAALPPTHLAVRFAGAPLPRADVSSPPCGRHPFQARGEGPDRQHQSILGDRQRSQHVGVLRPAFPERDRHLQPHFQLHPRRRRSWRGNV